MLCQNCGKNESNVRYTQVINGVKKQMHLCSKCAEELGIDSMDFNMPISFSSFLSDMTDMFDNYNDEYIPKLFTNKNLVCDNCKLSFEDFIENGRFGCEKCYENFENKINSILKNIHGIDTHSGRLGNAILDNNSNLNEKVENKKNDNDKEIKVETNNKSQIEILKERLEKEIKEERYEDAAKTRDEIKKLEK